jgi:hypothetical protein
MIELQESIKFGGLHHGKVFIGENSEIMQNQGWQDVEKNQ